MDGVPRPHKTLTFSRLQCSRMPSLRTMALVLALIAVASGGVAATQVHNPEKTAAGTHGVDMAENETNLSTQSHSSPGPPGTAVTHVLSVTVPTAMNGTTLHSLRLNYGGTGVGLSQGLSHYRARLYRQAGSENETEVRLGNTSLDYTETTVTYTFPDNRTLHAGDQVWVAISGVVNPDDPGPISVGITLNPSRNGPSGTHTLDIQPPSPTISPQGVIGDQTRIGVHDPEGATGFIVAKDADGSVIGTLELDPERELHMDIGIGSFVDADAEENGMTVELVAVIDSNGNGAFDPEIDEPYRTDGEMVTATVENAVFHAGTTTTDGTTTTSTTTTTQTPTTETPTTTPGFGVVVVLVGLLGAAVWGRKD